VEDDLGRRWCAAATRFVATESHATQIYLRDTEANTTTLAS
jgi:hypothetical protein